MSILGGSEHDKSHGFWVNIFPFLVVPSEAPRQSALHIACGRGFAQVVARILHLGGRNDLRDTAGEGGPGGPRGAPYGVSGGIEPVGDLVTDSDRFQQLPKNRCI